MSKERTKNGSPAASTTSLWRLPTVKQVTGLGRSYIYEQMKEGRFPEAVNLDGGPMVAWISEEVEAWVDQQIDVSRKAS